MDPQKDVRETPSAINDAEQVQMLPDNRGPGKQNPMKMNTYATFKTLGLGCIDAALFMKNGTQLKYLSHHPEEDPTNTVTVLLWTSSVLQIFAGILMFLIGCTNIDKQDNKTKAEWLNGIITVLIFIITVVNIWISIFDIGSEL